MARCAGSEQGQLVVLYSAHLDRQGRREKVGSRVSSWGGRKEHMGNSVVSGQFFCKPKTALV
jgi:hypothetical protein